MTERLIAKSAGMSRRSALKLAAGWGALAASTASGAQAQTPVTIRWWSPQSAPAQLKTYKEQIAAFQKQNPGVTVQFEPTSDESYSAQFAAAAAAKQLPQPHHALAVLRGADLLRARAGRNGGRRDPGGRGGELLSRRQRRLQDADGHYCGTGIGNTAADMLWLRKDLMQKAGLDKAPATWDELRDACRKMQGHGVYGAPLPYGLNSMTSLIFIGFIHRAGGQVFTPDLQVAIDSDETRKALEFYASMKEVCPPARPAIAGARVSPPSSAARPLPESTPAGCWPM